MSARATHTGGLPPPWAYTRPKPVWRELYDFALAPLRMALLPDEVCERLGLTSLRGERFAAVLPLLRGKVVDVGAGDNVLVRLYQNWSKGGPNETLAAESVGLDVIDWGGGCMVIQSAADLPLPDSTADVVTFVACLNHIPERLEALKEARRILRPGGRIIITMIGHLVGRVGHAIWWYSEDKHRDVDQEEEMGMDRGDVLALLREAGFDRMEVSTFVYGLNTLYIGVK